MQSWGENQNKTEGLKVAKLTTRWSRGPKKNYEARSSHLNVLQGEINTLQAVVIKGE